MVNTLLNRLDPFSLLNSRHRDFVVNKPGMSKYLRILDSSHFQIEKNYLNLVKTNKEVLFFLQA